MTRPEREPLPRADMLHGLLRAETYRFDFDAAIHCAIHRARRTGVRQRVTIGPGCPLPVFYIAPVDAPRRGRS